jgi:hypothetical protein
MRLDIAIPVCAFTIGRDYLTLARGGIVADNLKHRTVDLARHAPAMNKQQKAMPQQPTQIEAIQDEREFIAPAEQTTWLRGRLIGRHMILFLALSRSIARRRSATD